MESIETALDRIAKGDLRRVCYFQCDRDVASAFGTIGLSRDGLGLDIWDVEVHKNAELLWPKDTWWSLDFPISDLKRELTLRNTRVISASALGHWAPFLGVKKFKFADPAQIGLHNLHLAFSPRFVAQVLNRWAEVAQIPGGNFAQSDSPVLRLSEQLAKDGLGLTVVPSRSRVLSFENTSSSFLLPLKNISSYSSALMQVTHTSDSANQAHLYRLFNTFDVGHGDDPSLARNPNCKIRQCPEHDRDSSVALSLESLDNICSQDYSLVLAPLRARNLVEINRT